MIEKTSWSTLEEIHPGSVQQCQVGIVSCIARERNGRTGSTLQQPQPPKPSEASLFVVNGEDQVTRISPTNNVARLSLKISVRRIKGDAVAGRTLGVIFCRKELPAQDVSIDLKPQDVTLVAGLQ